MAEEVKQKLSEEELMELKLKRRKLYSNILIAVASLSIVIFVVMMFMTKQNVDTQTSIDTQELRSKLKQLIALERRYYEENSELVPVKYLNIARELERFDPSVDSDYKYMFDVKTGIATGMEQDISRDVNGDEDGKDGLTLSINWEPGKTDGSDFFWTEEDIADLQERNTTQEKIPVEGE